MIGWILSALTLGSLMFLLLPRKIGLVGWAGLVGIVLLPLHDSLSAAEYFRGIFGDLSLTTQLLLYGAVLSRITGKAIYDCCEKWTLLGFIAVAGALFYPFALGLSYFDPYRWGYGSYGLLLGLLLPALLAWQRGWYFSSLIVSVALLGWSSGLLESRNLWDYLLDPALFIYAIFGCLYKALTVTAHKIKKGKVGN